jgi:hypothetical protein
MKYKIAEDTGGARGGATEIVDAASLEEALEIAKEWASEGSYDERVMVEVWVEELDDDGKPTGRSLSGEVAAGPEPTPPETECGDEDEDHDWQSPVELVGGLDDNPGVFASWGTRFDFYAVCSRCGIYRHSWSAGKQRNPGALDRGVEYYEADEKSLAWVAEQLGEEVEEEEEEEEE